ncbi:MAG: hypothetical protein ACREQI_02055 [Candidatus Binataceae bacterium]
MIGKRISAFLLFSAVAIVTYTAFHAEGAAHANPVRVTILSALIAVCFGVGFVYGFRTVMEEMEWAGPGLLGKGLVLVCAVYGGLTMSLVLSVIVLFILPWFFVGQAPEAW